MQSAKHVSTGKNVKAEKRDQGGFYLILLTVLICVILGAVLISQLVGKQSPRPPVNTSSPVESSYGISQSEADAAVPSENNGPDPGTLLDSGSGLDSNFFAKINVSGSISNLTDTSFDIEPMTLGSDIITVHYSESTVVKTASLYYNSDTYEIFMGSLDDIQSLKDDVKYMFNIVFEDPSATEPQAKEIIISTYEDLA